MLPSVSSWQSANSTAENLSFATTAPPVPPSDPLVDHRFREKFMENQKKMVSSSNPVGLDRIEKRRGIVRFADEIPQDLRKRKEKEVLSPDSDEKPSPLQTGAGSEAKSDDDEDDKDDEDDGDDEGDEGEDGDEDNSDVELPRTKSQLTLLIQNRRGETGSRDLGPEPPRPTSPAESKGKGREKSKEEELLSMGRRDGVTKGGKSRYRNRKE